MPPSTGSDDNTPGTVITIIKQRLKDPLPPAQSPSGDIVLRLFVTPSSSGKVDEVKLPFHLQGHFQKALFIEEAGLPTLGVHWVRQVQKELPRK